MRPLIQNGAVVKQPKANNRNLSYYEEMAEKITEEEGKDLPVHILCFLGLSDLLSKDYKFGEEDEYSGKL